MAKAARPVACRGKWRIRWIDAQGKRQSDVYESYNEAERQLRKRQVEADEIKRGLRNAPPSEKTISDLCDYWLDKRAPRKRSKKDDESMIRKHLRPAFGSMRLPAQPLLEHPEQHRHVAVDIVEDADLGLAWMQAMQTARVLDQRPLP